MAEIKITKLSSKGQVVIPIKIRQNLNLEEGALLVVEEQGIYILLKKIQIPETEHKLEELNIETIKDKIIPILKKNSVTKAGIFGSYARGEQTENSDIDILIKSDKSLLGLVGLELELKNVLKKNVDLLTYRGINSLLKKRILKEEIRII